MLVCEPLYSAAALPSRWRIWVAKKRRVSEAKAKSDSRRSLYEVPVWSVSRRASSSACSSRRSPSRFMIATRAGISMFRQRPSRNDARAAATARSTSAAVPAGTRPTSSPLAGLWTSSQAPSDASTERPSTNIGKSGATATAMNVASWGGGLDLGASLAQGPGALVVDQPTSEPLEGKVVEGRVDQPTAGIAKRPFDPAGQEARAAGDPEGLVGGQDGRVRCRDLGQADLRE